MNQHCYLARYGVMEHDAPMPACQGQLIKAHLIPRQVLRREHHREAIDDPRSWVPACGGALGNCGHHGMLDSSRTLRLPFDRLPKPLLELADEIGLTWWLERNYLKSYA